jgi:putative ABC transport system ATP-binding protein
MPSEAPTGGGSLLSVENVSRTYLLGGSCVDALRGVSLALPAGGFVLVSGVSGSGKTTLLNLMGGLEQPSGGKVLFRGRDLASFSQPELTRWRRRDVGFVFQAFALLPELTARENVDLPLRIAGLDPAEVDERVARCLDLVGLAGRAHHRVFELSGGEQQRVAVARALVKRPRLILADEPTGELDQAAGRRVLSMLRSLVDQEGTTVCLTSHDPAVKECVDVCYRLRDGRIDVEERRHES